MSQLVINHSPDLKKLRDEGYEVRIIGSHLVVDSIPYLNSTKNLMFGKFITDIVPDQTGKASKPRTHVIHFQGDYPSNLDGRPIEKIRHNSTTRNLGSGLMVNHSFSNKPAGGFENNYDKVIHYINIVSAPAMAINPDVTPQTYKPVQSMVEENSPLCYLDTNASRAEIGGLMEVFKNLRIGIIGLGGTGSYILDSVAKTPVKEIHLIDGDIFLQHNAFRSPGAASIEDLYGMPKVNYYKRMYSSMHQGIFSHNFYFDRARLNSVLPLDFVFLSIDNGFEKKKIINILEELGISFIDVGMGVEYNPKGLIATIRTTASTKTMRSHIKEKNRISFGKEDEDEYSSNIQIDDLNAINAKLAVIKWKKFCGFYLDDELEYHSVFNINSNILLSDDFET
ncbi:ThiF family adenylyltransferase [Gramella sp. GC03-9]|uniref:ThiF family adenylyltransferase n=1 Tax=Christiangramia oceanisediminis TaxID=2920386 RepID=A0A9X2KVY9_9FLAO|nr:ThiF family adenylyltransferase [Gramella oceanisediminis]MCP9199245.1 ThiF family adenylyltransferase [Gramella oceanisediminis]